VEAISSTGRIIPCLIVEKNSLYTANFTPDEIGIISSLLIANKTLIVNFYYKASGE